MLTLGKFTFDLNETTCYLAQPCKPQLSLAVHSTQET